MGTHIMCPKCGKSNVINRDGRIRKHVGRMQKQIPGGQIKYCIASEMLYETLNSRLKVTPKYKERLPNGQLSARHVQVLDLLLKGYSHKETGYILNISHRTVDNHVAKMKKTLNINNRYDLIRWGMKQLKTDEK